MFLTVRYRDIIVLVFEYCLLNRFFKCTDTKNDQKWPKMAKTHLGCTFLCTQELGDGAGTWAYLKRSREYGTY